MEAAGVAGMSLRVFAYIEIAEVRFGSTIVGCKRKKINKRMRILNRISAVVPSFLLLLFLICCEKIETGETLSKEDLANIERLGLLEKNEKIAKFYSQFKKSLAGNFYTDRKIAAYWIDERDSTKNYLSWAYYQDIAEIDTNYLERAPTYAPYMRITKKDGTQFKVYAEGEKSELKAFFEEAMGLWRAHQGNK